MWRNGSAEQSYTPIEILPSLTGEKDKQRARKHDSTLRNSLQCLIEIELPFSALEFLLMMNKINI